MIRVIFFVLMACGLAGFGAVAWIITRQPGSHAASAQAVPRRVVLAAGRPVAAGGLLKSEDFVARQIVSEPGKSDDYINDTPDARRDLVGAMTRRPLSVGDPLRDADVIRPGEHGFLAAALNPGMRAVTITVDTGTGGGELIGPGDRVDLILTQSLTEPSLSAGHRVASETVLSDARVLAIDQKLVLGAANAPGMTSKDRTVTLEVTESQAQRLSIAAQLGHLSVSVRSADAIQTASASPPGGTVWAVDVSPALGTTASPPPPNGIIRVFPGDGDVKEFKF